MVWVSQPIANGGRLRLQTISHNPSKVLLTFSHKVLSQASTYLKVSHTSPVPVLCTMTPGGRRTNIDDAKAPRTQHNILCSLGEAGSISMDPVVIL